MFVRACGERLIYQIRRKWMESFGVVVRCCFVNGRICGIYCRCCPPSFWPQEFPFCWGTTGSICSWLSTLEVTTYEHMYTCTRYRTLRDALMSPSFRISTFDLYETYGLGRVSTGRDVHCLVYLPRCPHVCDRVRRPSPPVCCSHAISCLLWIIPFFLAIFFPGCTL